MDDEEEICPVCDGACTCNHQSPNRGSARANGYRPKPGGQSLSGKGDAFIATISAHTERTPSPELVSDEPVTPSKPLKIRLILSQRKPSATPAPVPLPSRSGSPSTIRRRRSVNYTSSSESFHSSSSRTNAKQYSRHASPSLESSRRLSPSMPTEGDCNDHKRRRGRPPKHIVAAREAAAREAVEVQGVFKEAAFGRPIRASAAVASSSLNTLAGPSKLPATLSSASKLPQPKAHTPSSAWFLGAPPPKSLNRHPKPAAGSARSHSQTSVPPHHGSGHDSSRSHTIPMKQAFPPTPKPKMVVKSANRPHTKKGHNATKPPRISNAASNRKRRKGPAYSSKFGAGDDSSLGELTPSEDEAYREEDYIPAPSLVPRTYPSSRGKPKKGASSHPSSSGVILGCPVGVTPGTYPKYVSDSSSSDESLLQGNNDTSDDEEEEDEDIMREEERMIMKEEKKRERRKERRKQRESGGSSGPDKNHQHKSPKGSDMDISSSLSSLSSSSSKSSSSSSGSSVDSDTETDNGEEDDDEDDDADADDIPVHTVEAGELTESEEEDMDADLFFANFLSDEDDAEGKDDSDHSSKEDNPVVPSAGPGVAEVAEARSDDEDADIFGAGFGVNGTSFVDADAFELLQRRRLFRPGHTGALSRSRGRGHPYRRPQGTPRKSINKTPDASTLITEDFDGRLVFGNPFEVGKGLVDMEWEERQRAVLLNDEDVTSEESVNEGDALMGGIGDDGDAANDDDDDAESTTETDFEGDTTFDEGLDEDGLPPQMAEQSQQLRSEQEFNERRLGHQRHPSDYSVPVAPQVLPPGVEVFQGGYSTVMYGRFDFPSLNPLGPHGRLASTTDFPEVWNGIQEEEKTPAEDGGTVKENPAPFFFSVPAPVNVKDATIEPAPLTSPTPQDILSGSRRSLDSFRFPATVQPPILLPPLELGSASIPTTDDTEQKDPLGTGDAEGNAPVKLEGAILDVQELRSSPEQEEPTPPSPAPRRLPTMGSFVINPAPPVDLPATSSRMQDDPPIPLPISATSTSVVDTSSRQSTISTPHKTSIFELNGPRGVAVIDDARKSNIPSPYASIKRRKKPRTADESDSMSQRSDVAFNRDFGLWNYSQMKRTASTTRSNRSSSFSQSLPIPMPSLLPPFEGVTGVTDPSFLHPANVLDPAPVLPFGNMFGGNTVTGSIDLSDVLDSAFLDEDESGVASDGEEDDGATSTTDHQDALRNLTRWDRVPMGTFRRARAFGSAGGAGDGGSQLNTRTNPHQIPSSPAGVSDGFSYGAMFRDSDPFGPTAASALWSDVSPGGGKLLKGKGKGVVRPGSKIKTGSRRPRILISPVIFPIKEEAAPSGEPDDIDMGLVTGVEEEEGYFSKKLGKGGRDGTERERKKRKFEKETATSSRSPVLKRAKSGSTAVGDDSQVAST
ncbi:hypothetical protein FRB95_006962 [Tulasnella sp. JGI-2019a]|nr:hypothetical protein FRB95_006962 [Tulasnella sp. JGI-2019a]